MTADKPETSSNSTTFPAAPSVSSSSSSSNTHSSLVHNSPCTRDCVLKSPSSLHDSTISRLIDAVSFDNERDTCCSISALIDQFESTVDQNNLPPLNHDIVPSRTLNFSSTTTKALEDLRSPLKPNTTFPKKQLLISPQKVAQRTTHGNRGNCSPHKTFQADEPAPALISSPETTELEEVYTILDEEVLLPVSVYNLKKQTVHIQADTTESSPSSSLGSSPTKNVQNSGKRSSVIWKNEDTKWGEREEAENTEERVYEEVNDPPITGPERNRGTSKRDMTIYSSSNSHIFHHSSRGAFTEVELNVDEDPLERMLILPNQSNQWEGLTSPYKHEAIYQNHESTLNYSQQRQPSSYSQPQYPTHSSHVSFSQSFSPKNQPSQHHQHLENFHSPVFHRSGPSNCSALHQTSYPISQNSFEALNNTRDVSVSYTQQKRLSGNRILNKAQQDRSGNKKLQNERAVCFYNGFSSAESLPGSVSVNISKDRCLKSPTSECGTLYSQLDYGCIMSTSDFAQTIQPEKKSPTKSYVPKQFGKHETECINSKLQPPTVATVSLQSNSEPQSAYLQSSASYSPITSSCKSKSLGDLTSEDISCNFQSKYHIISRSFVTSHMRKQKRKGTVGEAAFHSQSLDPLTEQLRKLVSLEGDDGVKESPQSPQLHQEAKSEAPSSSPNAPRDLDSPPPVLTRRLSSRSQSRVRHINSRARERQQEALKCRPGVVIDSTASIGGVVRRSKPALQNLPPNRHSTGSYIAGYLDELEDRGLPEGACTSLRHGNLDSLGDRYYTDDSLPSMNTSYSSSEPEVYFLLRL